MDDAARVDVLERGKDLSAVELSALDVERAVLLDVLENLAILGQLEHKVEAAFIVEGPVQPDDARMSIQSVEGVLLDGDVLLLALLGTSDRISADRP